jgi:hypothetical protein
MEEALTTLLNEWDGRSRLSEIRVFSLAVARGVLAGLEESTA